MDTDEYDSMNQFLFEKFGRRRDLRNIDFTSQEFRDERHQNKIGWDLSYANLSGSNFQGMDLQSVNFNGAILRNVNFTNAILDYASMHGVDLTGANLEGARVNSTELDPLVDLFGNEIIITNLHGTINLERIQRPGWFSYLPEEIVTELKRRDREREKFVKTTLVRLFDGDQSGVRESIACDYLGHFHPRGRTSGGETKSSFGKKSRKHRKIRKKKPRKRSRCRKK